VAAGAGIKPASPGPANFPEGMGGWAGLGALPLSYPAKIVTVPT
jgi:hypothetical protein